MQGYAVKDASRSIPIAEIKHAEALAGRLSSLGAAPTAKPTPICLGATLEQLLEQDQADVVSRRLFNGVRVEEEDRHDTFVGLLEGA